MSGARAGAAVVSKSKVIRGGFARAGVAAPTSGADRAGARALPAPRAAVLVVEDESVVAHDLQQTLAGLGYHAFAVAFFAEDEVARATERRPDVALVGLRNRGKTDGIETAQLLQERYGIPVVYLTAQSDDATLERAKQTRPYGYLLRPVKAAALKSAIEIALFRHQAEQAAPGSTPARGIPAAAPPPARGCRAPGAPHVRAHVERILASEDFDASPRSRAFLRYIVEEALAGRGADVTQSAIATRVFQRGEDFDATLDPIVRIQAGRLRRSLERYYLLAGKHDGVRIELPRGTYVPGFSSVARGDSAPAPEAPPRVAAAPVLVEDDWPSLVVRGFESAEPGPESEAAAARVTEELILETGRYRDVKTVLQRELDPLDAARGERVRFALGGRLRRLPDGLRVTATLVDRATGEQLWGDEYRIAPGPGRGRCGPEEVARVIAARVAAEEGLLVQRLAAERRKRRGAPVTPYGAILLSYEFLLANDAAIFPAALQALRQAVQMEPDCGIAWTRLARLSTANHAFEVSDLETPLEDAITHAHHGVRLDPASRRARSVLASALLVKGELEAARSEVEQALRLSPDSLCYQEMIGLQLALLGDGERGTALIQSARARNPHCLPHGSFGLWFDYLRRGEYGAAYQAALEYRDPLFFWRSVMRACCLGHLGRREEAEAEVAELLRRRPSFEARGRVLIGHYVKLPEVMSRVVDGLAKAGLKLA